MDLNSLLGNHGFQLWQQLGFPSPDDRVATISEEELCRYEDFHISRYLDGNSLRIYVGDSKRLRSNFRPSHQVKLTFKHAKTSNPPFQEKYTLYRTVQKGSTLVISVLIWACSDFQLHIPSWPCTLSSWDSSRSVPGEQARDPHPSSLYHRRGLHGRPLFGLYHKPSRHLP